MKFKELFENSKYQVEVNISSSVYDYDYTKRETILGYSSGAPVVELEFNVSDVDKIYSKVKSALKKHTKATIDKENTIVDKDGTIHFETWSNNLGTPLSKREYKEELKTQKRIRMTKPDFDRKMYKVVYNINILIDGEMMTQSDISKIFGIESVTKYKGILSISD